MGTHPIFESDFDCLTENRKMTDLSTVDDPMASYLDIDSILMEEQKITCQAKQNMIDLDFKRQKEDVQKGKKIELPIWLAEQLGEFFMHDIPKQYRTKFQNILSADPEVVNLHKEGPKYYSMGLKMMNHKFHFADTEDLVNLCNVLGRTFARRHSWINTMTEREGEKIDSRLDDMEKIHYARGCHQKREWNDWTLGLSDKLEESKLMTRSRKRRHDSTVIPMSQ